MTPRSSTAHPSEQRIRLAIVDDSKFVRKAIQRIVSGEASITIVGTAASGEELLENLEQWEPDVVTLDLSMPGIGGIETLDILARRQIPVIVFSSYLSLNPQLSVEAAYKGCVEFVDKTSLSLLDFDSLRNVLVRRISSLCAPAFEPAAAREAAPAPVLARRRMTKRAACATDVVVMGASTGGPPAIQSILSELADLPVPIVVVQHMPPGFTSAFASRLDGVLALRVKEAEDGEVLQPGTAYIARSGVHLTLSRDGAAPKASYSDAPSDAPYRPSVDVLFSSTSVEFGHRAVGVLLTGMGRDGAAGLREMFDAGAHTIAQDAATSSVWGMPRAAVEAGCVSDVMPLDAIAGRIRQLIGASTCTSQEVSA